MPERDHTKPLLPPAFCKASGCTREIPASMLMCGEHWKQVSTKTKAAIHARYQIGQGRAFAPSSEYLKAVRDAIKDVRQAEHG